MLKTVFFFSIVLFLGTACSSVRHFAAPSSHAPERQARATNIHSQKAKKQGIDVQRSSGRRSRSLANQHYSAANVNIENSNRLQFKYGIFMDVPVEVLSNAELLNYMDEWYGTPYRYGGTSKKGVDCSAFAGGLLATVFRITVPRTVREQYQASERIDRVDLLEGDLVFFNTTGGISHVGVYLDNDKFIHASASGGVMISDLNDAYFARRYVGGGRVRR